jgi:hypothetical protein
MMARSSLLPVFLVLAVALAGCAGNFNVKQTEPFRAQFERADVDGQAVELTVSSTSGTREGRVLLTRPADVLQIDVIVVARAAATAAGGGTSGTNASANATGGNATGNATSGNNTTTSGTVTIVVPIVLVVVQDNATGEQLAEQRLTVQQDSATTTLNIDVRGHDNVVVVTTAEQGDAVVNVQAKSHGQG